MMHMLSRHSAVNPAWHIHRTAACTQSRELGKVHDPVPPSQACVHDHGRERIAVSQAFNTPAVNMALMVFRDRLQHWLAKFCGYECQYVEGDCMLAFADHAQAVMFCLLVCAQGCCMPLHDRGYVSLS